MQSQTQTQAQAQAQAQAARDAYREQIRQQIREVRNQVRDGLRETVHGEQRQVIVEPGQPVEPVPPVPPVPPFEPVIAGGPPEQFITVRTPGDDFPHIPREAVDISVAFFGMIAVCTLAWAAARIFGRGRARPGAATLPADSSAQLQRIEQAVEAMAIEVERISEAQRYLTRLQNERERVPIPADARGRS